jgi:hypothetical protein
LKDFVQWDGNKVKIETEESTDAIPFQGMLRGVEVRSPDRNRKKGEPVTVV